MPHCSLRQVDRAVFGASITLLLLLLFSSVGTTHGAASSSTTLTPAGAPNPIDLPPGNPGSTVSAPITVYFTNASKPLVLRLISVTVLQTKNGFEIPNSSISVSPGPPITITGTANLVVKVQIPGGTKPGNYSGQLVLIGANGGVATLSMVLGISYSLPQYIGNYWVDFVFLVAGVLVSFVYSPLGDTKGNKKAKDDKASKVEEVNTSKPKSRFQKAVESRKSLQVLGTHVHLAILLSSIALGAAAFSYLLANTPGLGITPYHDAAISFLDGFAVHRLMDGVVPNAKNS